MNGLFRFIIFSYAILGGTCLVLFIYELFLQSIQDSILFQDFTIGAIILAIVIMIYSVYERVVGRTDSGLSAIALLPYKFDVVSYWSGLISLVGIIVVVFMIFTRPALWNYSLFVTGLEFSIIGWILSNLLDRVPGAMINDLKENGKQGINPFPYHLTQLNYSFLYTIVGISLVFAGIVVAVSRFTGQ